MWPAVPCRESNRIALDAGVLMSSAAASPPGLDLVRLDSWFSAAIPAAGTLRSARLIAGGKSNLTYAVDDGTTSWVVRRPPLGHVLATAHDMGREYRVISALQSTAVPVPAVFAYCADPQVIGAPFYVMARVEGRAYRQAAELAELGPERARAISTTLVDTLAELHAVKPDAVGLQDFGRPEGFLGRQVQRWKKQLDSSYSRDLPDAQLLYERLQGQVPPDGPAAIVHGDFRLDNALVDESDRLRAVVDWEMATLGDPLTDLALLVVYGRLGQALPGNAIVDVASAPGYLSEAEILGRYSESSGRDLSRLGFYLGLAAFKLAAILEGIHYRYLHGQTVGEGFDNIGTAIEPLLAGGLSALSKIG